MDDKVVTTSITQVAITNENVRN